MTWLSRVIPPATASEIGRVRVLLGLALAWLVWDMRLPAADFPVAQHLVVHHLADWDWVHLLAADPVAVARLEFLAIALALVFAVGLCTRLALGALTLALTAWTLVRLTHTGAHPWAVMLVTLWGWTLTTRWGDGASLDAWWARRRGRQPSPDASAAYGFALWLPGLTFSTAMCGAAIAKLAQSGFAWITNGTVAYYFVVDAAQAPTTWGLWVASHPPMPVLMSAGAILVEATLVLSLLCRHWAARLPFAAGAVGLLGGFYVFQNEFWPAWWALCLLYFVPWVPLQRILAAPPRLAIGEPRLPVMAGAFALLVVGLQVVASTSRVEVSPLMSDYPMYSRTWPDREAFERENAIPPVYHYSVVLADGREVDAGELFDRLEVDAYVRDAYVAEAEHRPGADDATAVFADATVRLDAAMPESVRGVRLRVDQRAFDWDTGEFVWVSRRRLAREYLAEAVSKAGEPGGAP
ncbi:MAG: hypothetical protein AB7O67_21470 [Vicinamibacterales bacterium]